MNLRSDSEPDRKLPGDVWIRPYEDKDAEQVRSLFWVGMSAGDESSLSLGMKAMRTEPITAISYPFLGFSISALFILKTWWIGVIAFTGCVIWILYWRHRLRRVILDFVQQSLDTDLADIGKHYAFSKRPEDDDGGVSAFWVAETSLEDGTKRVVGGVGLDSSRQKDKSQSELRRLCVSQEYRRRGIGSMLIKNLISYAHQRGLKAIVLSTLTYHPSAMAMYKGYGWVIVGTIRLEWFMGFMYLHMMHLAL